MSEAKITADMLEDRGPIVQKLFRAKYPEGLTRKELEALAPAHSWLRRVLKSLDKEG